ncbi:M15 family metallopeptidase [Lysinibacillus sp. 54212]|uniref:M15 family metallopeptidase n=1 Tax=Lysinibacillus sp. 54212 TaxID=3119829 RepID=UPI002FC6F889
MRKSRTNRYKSNKLIIVSAIISFVLIVSIVAIVLNKNAKTDDVNGTDARHEEASKIRNEEQPNKENEPLNQAKSNSEKNEPKEEPTDVKVDAGGYPVNPIEVKEPTFVQGVLIASKKYPLPKTFNPGEDPTARAALNEMIAAAKKDGFVLVAFSGFRSYEYQNTLYTNYVNRDGKEAADRYSARPGYSEHQTGLSFDIGEKGQEDLWLTSEFGETEAGRWLVNNAHKYGFILRYPKGKENVTGYMYESWHFRYLGKELAEKVYQSRLTLEEYLKID